MDSNRIYAVDAVDPSDACDATYDSGQSVGDGAKVDITGSCADKNEMSMTQVFNRVAAQSEISYINYIKFL